MSIDQLRFSKAHTTRPGVRCGLVVPTLGNGGLEEAVAILATGLPQLGIETSVLCTHEGGAVADRLKTGGVRVTVGAGSKRTWRSWAKDAGVNVVSTHFASLASVDAIADLAPVVETIQNTYVWYSPKDWEDERAKAIRVKSLVAVSETVAAYYRRACGATAPMSIIPNGVDGGRVVAVSREDARARLNLGRDDIVLVNVGRFCLQKNQAGLVDSLRDLLSEDRRVRLLLVGGQDDREYMQLVQSAAGDLIERGSLRLLPFTAEPGVAVSAADAFVSNSFFEGWSLAATEALWLGRPVILSDCGGSRELIGTDGQRGTLVCNPGGDPATLTLEQARNPARDVAQRNRLELSNAVLALIAHRDQWSSRSDQIMKKARTTWSADLITAAYADVFRRVAGMSA